jgi:hypothetical protein
MGNFDRPKTVSYFLSMPEPVKNAVSKFGRKAISIPLDMFFLLVTQTDSEDRGATSTKAPCQKPANIGYGWSGGCHRSPAALRWCLLAMAPELAGEISEPHRILGL